MAAETPDQYLLMSSIEQPVIGDKWQRDEQLPPHITVMPWFHGAIMPAVINGLQNICSHTEPFTVTVGNEASVTPNDDVPIQALTRAGRLSRLHAEILELVQKTRGVVESDQIGPRYQPHVNYLGHVGLAEGELVQLSTLELVGEYKDGSRQVQRALRFSGHVR